MPWLDLTPYVNDPVWGLPSDEQADFYPAFWEEDLVTYRAARGKPGGWGYLFTARPMCCITTKAWAQELGYPNPPITAEDFRVQACAAARIN